MTKKTSPAYRASKEETIPINKLHPFSNHPFHIRHDLEFSELVDSISESGIITPIIVRPKVGVGYEVISGHRRWEACKELGIESIPARVEYIDDDEATILMVNSNIQREHVLPSEKAFAYKMRMEALKHQGRTTLAQVGPKFSSEKIAAETGDSRNQVKRYIRLTYLIPSILQMVDDGHIAFNPAVEISYMTEEHQTWLKEEMDMCDATPSLVQSRTLKDMSRNGTLTENYLHAQEQKYLRKTITGILSTATGMADFADKLKTAGIETKVKKATGQVLYRATVLDGAWVPEDALGSEFTSEGIEYALKNGEMQIAEDAEITLIDRYQELTIQYPEVCTAAVKLSSRQILSAGKNGLVLQVHDDNDNPAKLMVNKREVTTSSDGEITFNVGNDFSYDVVYEDGTHGTIRGTKLIQQIDEENNVLPLAVVLTEDQIKTMSLRGVTIALPSKGIERLFIPEKYVVCNAANGQCAVSLYPNHQYSYIPTSGENKRNSIQGDQLAAILGVAINPSTENTTLSRRIAAVERRMGIENAKNLGKVLLGMTSENMYTAADYDKAILSLGKKQIDLTNKISAMQEKRKEVAAVTKSLQICKTYRPVWMQYVELPMSQKSAFYSGHSTELQAYSSAAKNLEKEGIDQSVDLDKAIGFTEQLERKIEETKEQLRETNSEEKKAQQERKKVLDIQENHTIN